MDPCVRKATFPSKVSAPPKPTKLIDSLNDLVKRGVLSEFKFVENPASPSAISSDTSSATSSAPTANNTCPPPTTPTEIIDLDSPPAGTDDVNVPAKKKTPTSPLTSLLTPLILSLLSPIENKPSTSAPTNKPSTSASKTTKPQTTTSVKRKLFPISPKKETSPTKEPSAKLNALEIRRRKSFAIRPPCSYIIKKGSRKGETCGKQSEFDSVVCKLHSMGKSKVVPQAPLIKLRVNRLKVGQRYFYHRKEGVNGIVVGCKGVKYIIRLPRSMPPRENISSRDYLIRTKETGTVWRKTPQTTIHLK